MNLAGEPSGVGMVGSSPTAGLVYWPASEQSVDDTEAEVEVVHFQSRIAVFVNNICIDDTDVKQMKKKNPLPPFCRTMWVPIILKILTRLVYPSQVGIVIVDHDGFCHISVSCWVMA